MKTPFTTDELKYIQYMAGTTADGYIGRRTIRAIQIFLNTSEKNPLRLLVLMAQRLINLRAKETRKPENSTKEDGIFGPMTDALIANLVQSNIEETATGVFGTELVVPKRPEWTKELPSDKTDELIEYFGKPGENHTMLNFPYPMYYGDTLVSRTTVNKKAAEHFAHMFNLILETYGKDGVIELGLDQYSGCYNNRSIRGGSRLSTHAFAVAMDLNAANNRLRTPLKKALFGKKEYQGYWDAVYAAGFTSLALHRDMDAMHIQLTK